MSKINMYKLLTTDHMNTRTTSEVLNLSRQRIHAIMNSDNPTRLIRTPDGSYVRESVIQEYFHRQMDSWGIRTDIHTMYQLMNNRRSPGDLIDMVRMMTVLNVINHNFGTVQQKIRLHDYLLFEWFQIAGDILLEAGVINPDIYGGYDDHKLKLLRSIQETSHRNDDPDIVRVHEVLRRASDIGIIIRSMDVRVMDNADFINGMAVLTEIEEIRGQIISFYSSALMDHLVKTKFLENEQVMSSINGVPLNECLTSKRIELMADKLLKIIYDMELNTKGGR